MNGQGTRGNHEKMAGYTNGLAPVWGEETKNSPRRWRVFFEQKFQELIGLLVRVGSPGNVVVQERQQVTLPERRAFRFQPRNVQPVTHNVNADNGIIMAPVAESIRRGTGDGTRIELVFKGNLKLHHAIHRPIYRKSLRQVVFCLPPRTYKHQHISQHMVNKEGKETDGD